jgi:hypothetical protein
MKPDYDRGPLRESARQKRAPDAPACTHSGLVAMIARLCAFIIVASRPVAGTLP